jgi:hypothetical protein
VVRTPSEETSEMKEPICISKIWEDRLFYDVAISGKSFPLGSRIPIALKLTPLAKARLHKFKVYVTESIEYLANNGIATRKQRERQILLLEKVAGKPLANDYSMSEVVVRPGELLDPEGGFDARRSAMRSTESIASQPGRALEPQPQVTKNNTPEELDLGEQYWTETEIEMSVQLPTCDIVQRDRSKRIAHDCTWKNAKVYHWIKVFL